MYQILLLLRSVDARHVFVETAGCSAFHCFALKPLQQGAATVASFQKAAQREEIHGTTNNALSPFPQRPQQAPCCWLRPRQPTGGTRRKPTSWAKFLAIRVPMKVDLPTLSASLEQIRHTRTRCKHVRIEIGRERE